VLPPLTNADAVGHKQPVPAPARTRGYTSGGGLPQVARRASAALDTGTFGRLAVRVDEDWRAAPRQSSAEHGRPVVSRSGHAWVSNVSPLPTRAPVSRRRIRCLGRARRRRQLAGATPDGPNPDFALLDARRSPSIVQEKRADAVRRRRNDSTTSPTPRPRSLRHGAFTIGRWAAPRLCRWRQHAAIDFTSLIFTVPGVLPLTVGLNTMLGGRVAIVLQGVVTAIPCLSV
jgi:hypothetical protein